MCVCVCVCACVPFSLSVPCTYTYLYISKQKPQILLCLLPSITIFFKFTKWKRTKKVTSRLFRFNSFHWACCSVTSSRKPKFERAGYKLKSFQSNLSRICLSWRIFHFSPLITHFFASYYFRFLAAFAFVQLDAQHSAHVYACVLLYSGAVKRITTRSDYFFIENVRVCFIAKQNAVFSRLCLSTAFSLCGFP